MLINLEKVGDLGHREDDVCLLGKCDDIIRELARELGWEKDLQKAWEATAESVELEKEKDKDGAAAVAETSTSDVPNKTEKERLQLEVDKLTSDVEKSLALTDNLRGGEKETTEPNLAAKRGEPVLQIPEAQKEAEPSIVSEADIAEGSRSPKAQQDGKL